MYTEEVYAPSRWICPINAILVPLDVELDRFYVRFSFSASSFSTLFQLYRIDGKIIRQIIHDFVSDETINCTIDTIIIRNCCLL